MPVVLRFGTTVFIGFLSAVLTLVPQNTQGTHLCQLRHQSMKNSSITPSTSKWRENSADIPKTITNSQSCLLTISDMAQYKTETVSVTFLLPRTGYRSKHWGWWSQPPIGSPMSQFLPLAPRRAQDVSKSFTKAWEVSFRYGSEHIDKGTVWMFLQLAGYKYFLHICSRVHNHTSLTHPRAQAAAQVLQHRQCKWPT